VLPAIATCSGARATPTVVRVPALVHSGRRAATDLGGADVAYVLGHDAALGVRGLGATPCSNANLARARDPARRGPAVRREPLRFVARPRLRPWAARARRRTAGVHASAG